MSLYKKSLLLIIVSVCLSGCAAVGVFSTSNPDRKLQDAYAMIRQGRYIRAKQFTEEALNIYKNNDDEFNVARSHSMLGDILRDGKGRYFPNYSESLKNYEAAAKIHQSQKRFKWESLNLYAQAGVLNIQGKKTLACETLLEAEQTYSKSPSRDQKTESFEKAGYFSYERFGAIKKHFGC